MTAHNGTIAWCLMMIAPAAILAEERHAQSGPITSTKETHVTGRFLIDFDVHTLARLGLVLLPDGTASASSATPSATFELFSTTAFRFDAERESRRLVVATPVRTRGIAFFERQGTMVMVGRWLMEETGPGRWKLTSGARDVAGRHLTFEWSATAGACGTSPGECVLAGDLLLTRDAATLLGSPDLSGATFGRMVLETWRVDDAAQANVPLPTSDPTTAVRSGDCQSTGPDIFVCDLPGPSVKNWARDEALGITAYSFATTACNIGDTNANWNPLTADHPVIAQNVYRLKESRFEQIGLAWVKHGFYSMSDLTIDLCIDCQPFPILPGDEFLLKVGCKDMYDQRLNGDYAYLGPRQIVNASTGEFVLTYTAPTEPSGIDRRVQLHDVDLDPDLNAGALYFYEGQYIAADDAAAGNNNNNATYRPLTVLEDTLEPNNFLLRLAGSAQDTKPGILAWQDNDTDVRIEYIDVPNDGRLILGCKVWRDSATGLWHYEYAVQNLNSHRSARALSVPVPPGIDVTTIDFHDINVHSGAPCDVDGTPCQTTDWASTLGGGQVSWSTDTFAANEFANAIRWGSLYNFRFDADTCPTEGTVTLGLFRDPQSGDPTAMSVPALVPGDPIVLIDSQPIDGSIDARQPSNPDGTNPAGWQEIQLVFNRCATDLTSLDFSIDPAVPAAVATPASDTTIDFLFEAPINVKVWTTITHTATNTAIDVGYLPADINADGVSQSNDIAALTAALDTLPANGTTPPMHSIDIDRSDAPTAADILRAIDLLNGADDYEEFLDAALP